MDRETKQAFADLRQELRDMRKDMNARFDEAEAEREVMWHAFLSPVEVPPGQTLAEAVVERSRPRKRAGRPAQPVPLAAKNA